jgi:N-glycosylase/DNA lyase
MNHIERNGEVEITGAHDFDPAATFGCGQCFRWEADADGAFIGVAMGRVARVRREGGSVFVSGTAADFDAVWRGYFDLDRDYAQIRRQVSIDSFMHDAAEYGAGIRILRQDKWEALCSFIVSQRNNIPRIKKIIAELCKLFGDAIGFRGGEFPHTTENPDILKKPHAAEKPDNPKSPEITGNPEIAGNPDVAKHDHTTIFYTFPPPEKLAGLREADLAPLRCGYRAAYIIDAARAVAGGAIDLDALAGGSAEDARAALKRLRGVGDKGADCVLLFGLHMLDAFPRDVWINRAIAERYGRGFDPAVFAPYAGVAQQYMYHYIRSHGLGVSVSD